MSVRISRVLHAGYVFESKNNKIIFDPIFENPFSHNCYAFPEVQFDHKKIQFSAVFISHYHDDHCSFDSLVHIHRQTPIYIFCVFDEMISMIQKLGFKNVYQLKANDHVQIGDFEIIIHPALDVDVDSIFQIKIDGLNILNVVDSWIDNLTLIVLSKQGPWDLILWPFQTMREIEVIAPTRAASATTNLPIEWIDQLKILNPKYIVPSSCQFQHEDWSWYNHALFPISYREFKFQIKQVLPETATIRLNPSVSYVLDQNAFNLTIPLDWVIPVGDQNVDYEYNAELKPPSTSEISKKFAALTDLQNESIFEYCRNELIQKINSLEKSTDDYFNQNLIWKLSIYDHNGFGTDFYYQILNSEISIFNYNGEQVSWLTEIPISKFYAALNFGESLTSMYIRINDCIFDSETENKILDVDIIDDPLIRCLFNKNFGSYQQAQLHRIQLKTGPLFG